jgi:hypothetical protein
MHPCMSRSVTRLGSVTLVKGWCEESQNQNATASAGAVRVCWSANRPRSLAGGAAPRRAPPHRHRRRRTDATPQLSPVSACHLPKSAIAKRERHTHGSVRGSIAARLHTCEAAAEPLWPQGCGRPSRCPAPESPDTFAGLCPARPRRRASTRLTHQPHFWKNISAPPAAKGVGFRGPTPTYRPPDPQRRPLALRAPSRPSARRGAYPRIPCSMPLCSSCCRAAGSMPCRPPAPNMDARSAPPPSPSSSPSSSAASSPWPPRPNQDLRAGAGGRARSAARSDCDDQAKTLVRTI